MDRPEEQDKLRWIINTGWKGLCVRCGEKTMFSGWLQIARKCPSCDLDYRFASPDDGPAFFSLCFVAFPLTFFGVWFQVVFDPPFWVHFLTTIPVMVAGCVLALRPIKGWLVASQYLNNAQEAGTAKLWAKLHAEADDRDTPPNG